MAETVTPQSISEVAAALAGAAGERRPVRIVGGGTKLGWGRPAPRDALHLRTDHLSRTISHTSEGLTASVGAGTPLARAQGQFAKAGRMLAIDPQLGLGQRPAATLGGVIATADSGPLAHRYGPPQRQLVGVTVALSDGNVIRVGSRGDDEQNGYDLTRLLTGSFGTLGVIVSVDVRLQPLPVRTATALASTDEPQVMRDAVLRLATQARECEAFDVAWRDGRGGLLAQLSGDAAEARATRFAEAMVAAGLRQPDVRTSDTSLWARQRAGQRSTDHAVLRVHARRSQLDQVLSLAAAAGADLVGRAALGISYLTLTVNQIATVRAGLPADAGAVALDLPGSARGAVDPWGLTDPHTLELMRSVKQSFDLAGVCNPGVFVGRI